MELMSIPTGSFRYINITRVFPAQVTAAYPYVDMPADDRGARQFVNTSFFWEKNTGGGTTIAVAVFLLWQFWWKRRVLSIKSRGIRVLWWGLPAAITRSHNK